MDTLDSHILTVLGVIRDTQVRQESALAMITQNQVGIGEQQSAILKALEAHRKSSIGNRFLDILLSPKMAKWVGGIATAGFGYLLSHLIG